MSRLPRPFEIDGLTPRELRKMRNRKTSQLNYIKRILAGEQQSMFFKSYLKMYERVTTLQLQLSILEARLPQRHTRLS